LGCSRSCSDETDDTHDMGLMTVLIDGVAHRLSVNGETFVLLSMTLVPALQGAVQMSGFDADEHIADDGLAGDDVAGFLAAAAEALPGLWAEAVGPIRDGLVAAHPAQDGAGGNG